MVIWLLKQQWKETLRSPMWQKNLVLNLIIGFFLLLMVLYLLMLGILINKIFDEVYPGENHFKIFNGYLLYYFLVDLFLRFLLQGLPRLTIESYLHLPIRKSRILHFIVGKTAFAIFNYLPLLILIPVAIKIIGPEVGAAKGWIWMLIMIAMIFSNNFLATYLKRQLGSKPWVVAIYGLAIILLIVLDYYNVISLFQVSSGFFEFLVSNFLFLLIPLAWMVLTYSIHYYFLKARLYPEEIQVRKSRKIDSISNIRYLKSLGIIGSIIALELRLYWRNKRTKSMIYMLPIFLLYGFFFYPQEAYMEMKGMLIFVGIFMSGGMMLNYVNYAFGYESGYFDALMTKNINFRQYIRVKYIIAILISTICFILTIPYVFFGKMILFINFATYLYNIGVLSFVLLYMATFNKRRMDLTRGAVFNYQGMSSMNWLAMFPAFLVPVLIYWPFGAAGYPNAGFLFIGILGVIGLIFHKTILGWITNNFYSRKYMMAAGFRQR